MKRIFTLSVILIMIVCSTIAYAGSIAVIGAMDSEIAYTLQKMQCVTKHVKAGIIFYTGKINGKDIVLFKSGVGKVNSAMAVTMALERYPIDAIIFTGVAGGVASNLNIADVVIADKLLEHDYDTSPLGEKKGNVPGSKDGIFLADIKLMNIAKQVAERILGKDKVHIGIIATGDQFIATIPKVQKLREEFNASAVEMEGASVAHVATLYGVPIVVIRAISDKADMHANVNFNEFEEIAAKNASKIVVEILGEL